MTKIWLKLKEIDKGTLTRTILMVLAYANQIIAIFGASSFASAAWYQWLSLGITAAISFINAWQNNDFTYFAKLGTNVLDALEDGKVTEDEVKEILGIKSSN